MFCHVEHLHHAFAIDAGSFVLCAGGQQTAIARALTPIALVVLTGRRMFAIFCIEDPLVVQIENLKPIPQVRVFVQ